MSNPYLSFLASLGGSTGSQSTLQKLAATTSSSPSPSTSSSSTTTTTITTNLHRTHASSSRPTTTAPRLPAEPSSSASASKHTRHGSSLNSYSHSSSHSTSQSSSYSRSSTSSSSKPRSSSSHQSSIHSNGTHSRDRDRDRDRDYHRSSNSSTNASNSYGSSHGSSRNNDRVDSKNYGHGQDRRHSNGSKSHVNSSSRDNSSHRDDRNGNSSSYTSGRNDRKRERDVDTGRSDDPRGHSRTTAPKDKDASFSEPRAKKRHARSRSRSQTRTRSRSRSRSRSPSRTGLKNRQRSISPRRITTTNSRSKSRGRSMSRTRSASPMQIVQDSQPATPPSPSPVPASALPESRSPTITEQPFANFPPPVPVPVPAPSPPQQQPPPPQAYPQHSFLDLDDTSSFSTLSSPSSYSLSPPPRSVPSSPSKDHSPIKKRRLESLLHTEASYSSPSSLSSLSPEPSDRSSSERELEEGELSPFPTRETEADMAAQEQIESAKKVLPKKESVSQQSLELELFGKVLSKPSTATKKSDAATISKNSSINGHRKPDSNLTLERKALTTSLINKSKHAKDTDEEEYGSLGSIVKDGLSLTKRSNGHSGPSSKRSSVDTVRTSREIVTINTEKGTVTSKVIKTISKPSKPSNGTTQRPSKSISSPNTSKESSQKALSSTATGIASRRLSILHSDQIVAAAMGRYKNHFHMLVEDSDSTVASNPSSTGGDSMHVSLEYPGKDSREKFTLMKPFLSRSKTESDDKDEYNPIEDLVQTVRIIMEHFFTQEQYKELFGTANEGLYRSLTKYKNRKDGAQFMKAVEEFNQIMRTQKSLGKIQEHVQQYGHRLPYDLVVHLLQQVYSRTVAARASKLNQYEAFSNNVYGEILPILTKEFIQRTKMDETKVFVDLGCGIGNVVLQVALQTGAESYGVEIMDTPAKFAKKQAKEFEARTRAFGLHHGAVSMIHGDFLDTPNLAGILARADVVLVNNYAFNSALNQSLLQLFLDLKEGCKIISLKTFVSLDHKINVRNAGSVESILRVKKYPYYTNAVSWTHNGGEYFIATVDRSAVQAFWERAMSDGGASLDDGGSRRSSTRRR